MKRDWPVRETWRASLILGVVLAAATARGDARALVVEARAQDAARIGAWSKTLATYKVTVERPTEEDR